MRIRSLPVVLLLLTGCATIFGWDIHAPGLLSESYYQDVGPISQRLALYLDSGLTEYVSTDRGGRLADPQTYHVGEAFEPMLIEAFSNGFDEFIFLEVEPTKEILAQYAVPYLVYIRVREFGNQVTLKGQALGIMTETMVFDPQLELVDRFEAKGLSDAKKVFAKKGGPQVNLNAALEHNIRATIHHIQDAVMTGAWKGKTA